MSTWENNAHNVEHANIVNVQPTSAAHDEIFSSPQDYLTTLKSNFAPLSHGHDSINLNDLKIDMKDDSLDPRTREAARIAAAHFNDLQGINSRQNELLPASDGITNDDLSFAQDMVNRKITGHAIKNAAKDLGASIFTIGSGTILNVTGSAALGEGAALVGATCLGGGIAATGFGVYAGYEGIRAYHNLSKASDDDTAMIKSWLK